MKKAIIAMSGGVDSSVAAYFVSQLGYECYGVTMKLHEGYKDSCCTEQDINDAQSVADKLSFPYSVVNFKSEFDEKVIRKFIRTYEQGGTPNPCIDCNRELKFGGLLDLMKEKSFDYVVTGHYADIEEKDGWYYLKRGQDLSKDQSYVLYSLTQEQLAHTMFPLGRYSKDDIRKIAEDNGFINANKHDSQDICFIPDGDYASFIERYNNKTYPKGKFIDTEGNVLGEHSGIIRYTIGQRKGLGISAGKPVYVVKKNIADNTVVLGSNDDLMTEKLYADDFNWIVPNPEDVHECYAKTRYNMKEQKCKVHIENDRMVVEFFEPVRAVTPGQAVVLYDGDYVLGGGTIL